MTEPEPGAIADRLRQLEARVAALQKRVRQLEDLAGPALGEHATDRVAVRQKVSYDWQA